MPIVSSDLKTRYSTKLGTAGNQLTGTAAGSLGKYVSTTDWPGGTINDLFPDVSGADNLALVSEYRCIFIVNTHGSLSWTSPVIWISAEVAGGANVSIGVDPTAASVIGSSSDQAVSVATGQTAPVGVTFSAPTTQGAGLALGDIPAGQCKAFWVKRTATNSPALSNDGVTLTMTGDTAA